MKRFAKSMSLVLPLLFLAACGGGSNIQNVPVGDILVRQVPVSGSNSNTPDGKLNVFIFIPVQARPLEERIDLVEQLLESQGTCRLGTQDRQEIARLTRGADGDDQTVLMAPIKC